MMRPVINLGLGKIEMIGTFEQVYMDICITPEEAHEGVSIPLHCSLYDAFFDPKEFIFSLFLHKYLQSNFNGLNIFWTMEICSRDG